MLSKKIFITPSSKNIQKEFYSYTWKKDKNGKYLAEPIDCLNHSIDAIRYIVTDMDKSSITRIAPASVRHAMGI